MQPTPQHQPTAKQELIDINYRKVRESCERIANVLGISNNPVVMNSLQNSKPPITQDYFSPNKKDDTTRATNFYNPR